MPLKPWYKVVTPREDLREGKPLDASEFAIHLDQVRDGRANVDYQNPVRFFEWTFLTTNLRGLAAEALRRLSGEKTETSAVFNMATQFGGGKTHTLTLLYHLATHGPRASAWPGVSHILAQAGIEATYPFHPMVLSVFERKWQELPRFQQTRGMLRLLALWVSHAYQQGFKGARQEPLIDLGSAPLEDPQFRSAVFEQLGESRLEGAVTTDICGKIEAHAVRLDAEAVQTIKKASLHKKIATTIFFESNGGQTRNEASLPEIRLAAGPEYSGKEIWSPPTSASS